MNKLIVIEETLKCFLEKIREMASITDQQILDIENTADEMLYEIKEGQ